MATQATLEFVPASKFLGQRGQLDMTATLPRHEHMDGGASAAAHATIDTAAPGQPMRTPGPEGLFRIDISALAGSRCSPTALERTGVALQESGDVCS